MDGDMVNTAFRAGIREVSTMGMLRVRRASRPMRMETHAGEYEILYLQAGEKLISVAGRDYLMRGGDLLIIRPGEAHGQIDFVQNRSSMYYLFLKDPVEMEGFLGLDRQQRRHVGEGLSARRLMRAGDEIRRLLERLFAAAKEEDALRAARLRALMVLLLDEIVHGDADPVGRVPADIQRTIDRVEQESGEWFTVGQLAEIAGLSEAHFKQKFKQHTGVPPAEYVVRAHVRMAQNLLRETNDSATEIAMRLGFSSSQHFSKLFRRYVGLTPTQFRDREG